jgi:glycosyltransferase involved in cell wall biosynthesis
MKMNFSKQDHIFVICAYKENPYLKECIQSLLSQSCKSDIILVTSTPNNYIRNLCDAFKIPFVSNPNANGIASDWNFAYENATNKKLITIVHQDDIYESEYVCQILKMANNVPEALILYTDYYEIRNDAFGGKQYSNRLLVIKRIMNFPLRFSILQHCKCLRRFILAFGNPICCPSVSYIKSNLPPLLFDPHFKNSWDYKAWVLLSRLTGAFVYSSKCLVGHRIYENSSTSINIADNSRDKEDLEIFFEFWPRWMARFIYLFYQRAQKGNRIKIMF